MCSSVHSCLSPASQPVSQRLFSLSQAWRPLAAAHAVAPRPQPALPELNVRCAESLQNWLCADAEPDGGKAKITYKGMTLKTAKGPRLKGSNMLMYRMSHMGILPQQQQEISLVDGEISSAEDSVSIISSIIIIMILFENTNIKNEVQGPFLWSEI